MLDAEGDGVLEMRSRTAGMVQRGIGTIDISDVDSEALNEHCSSKIMAMRQGQTNCWHRV